METRGGTIDADQNRFTEAEPWLNGALSRARKFGDLRCEVMVLRDLGRMHLWQSRYDEALEHFQRSRTLAVELDSPHEEALAVEHIGRVHASRGRQEEAAEHYERALALFERLEAGFEVCNTAALLGLTRARQGRYEESRHAAERALAVAKELGDPVSEASMWGVPLGDVWRRLGDTQQARRMLDASGAICDGQEFVLVRDAAEGQSQHACTDHLRRG